MNEADRNSYFVSAMAWLLGGCWQFLAATSLVRDTIRGAREFPGNFLTISNEAAAQMARTMSLTHQVIAVAIAFGCFACIMMLRSSEQSNTSKILLRSFFLKTHKPMYLAGFAGGVVSLLLFCTSEGLDYRHAYLLGVALGGILVMALVAIAALAFFKIESPVKKKKPRAGKAKFSLVPCLIQSVGCFWVCAIVGSVIGLVITLIGSLST